MRVRYNNLLIKACGIDSLTPRCQSDGQQTSKARIAAGDDDGTTGQTVDATRLAIAVGQVDSKYWSAKGNEIRVVSAGDNKTAREVRLPFRKKVEEKKDKK